LFPKTQKSPHFLPALIIYPDVWIKLLSQQDLPYGDQADTAKSFPTLSKFKCAL
jgi:hypothetical protein